MSEKVYFLETADKENISEVTRRLEQFLKKSELLTFIKNRDFVAVKTHFGEKKINGFIRPEFMGMLNKLVRERGGNSFLTETSTLYRGDRSNAVDHIRLASDHGFTVEKTGMPVVMADGLYGGEEVEVDVKGEIYKKVKIASLLSRIQGLIVATHFTGHIVSGFGGALKNMGMGLASRRGKMVQHSTSKPLIKKKKCTACGECMRWCPVDAIEFKDGKAEIDSSICIGCAECLAVCRYDAVVYNWSESYEKLQKKITEHAMGVSEIMGGKALYMNFLTNISKDCDCMGTYERVSPDIGILISEDPVAIDSASLYLIEKRNEKKLSELSHNIPYRVQLEHADKIGFGTTDFEIVEVD
ncbi:MAG: DUF362 domain-containing protein [Acidobacteriota bacterium]